jgi:tetratricopeptide (TPR) repeat protein
MNVSALDDAMTLHQAGRLSEAAAIYRAILAEDRDHADSLHLLGLITSEQQNPTAGIALIRRAMVIQPGRAPHHNSLGHAYRRLGRLEDAVREYRTGVALLPQSAEIHSNLATTLLDLGRRDEAVVHYRQAAAHAPGMAVIWYNLANALATTSAVAETERCYRKALAVRPDYLDALGNFGRWLMTRARWDEAESQLAQSVSLAPKQAPAWNNLGVVSQELGRPAAEPCYRHALEIDPGLADAHYNLGCLLSQQGRSDEAVACHRQAVAINPGLGAARVAACMAELPILYVSQDEVEQRRSRYAEALQGLAAGNPVLQWLELSRPSLWRSLRRRTSASASASSVGSSAITRCSSCSWRAGSPRSTAAGSRSSVFIPGAPPTRAPAVVRSGATVSCKGQAPRTDGDRRSRLPRRTCCCIPRWGSIPSPGRWRRCGWRGCSAWPGDIRKPRVCQPSTIICRVT